MFISKNAKLKVRLGEICELGISFGRTELVAQASARGDQAGPEFPTQTIDQNLDDIRVAVKILIINMFRQFGLGNDLLFVLHQVFQDPVFQGSKVNQVSIGRDTGATGIDQDVAVATS